MFAFSVVSTQVICLRKFCWGWEFEYMGSWEGMMIILAKDCFALPLTLLHSWTCNKYIVEIEIEWQRILLAKDLNNFLMRANGISKILRMHVSPFILEALLVSQAIPFTLRLLLCAYIVCVTGLWSGICCEFSLPYLQHLSCPVSFIRYLTFLFALAKNRIWDLLSFWVYVITPSVLKFIFALVPYIW